MLAYTAYHCEGRSGLDGGGLATVCVQGSLVIHLQAISKVCNEFFWAMVAVAADVTSLVVKHLEAVLCGLLSPMYFLDAGLLLSCCCVCFPGGLSAYFCRVDVEASFLLGSVLWSGAQIKFRSIQFFSFSVASVVLSLFASSFQ